MNPFKIYPNYGLHKYWLKEPYDKPNQNGIVFQTDPKLNDCG
jgi:hypothetical protein